MSLWSPLEAALEAWPVEHISRQRLLALADALTPMAQLALQSGDPPDALAALLDPAFASALRALGISTLGPAYKLAPELTRAVSAEERKLQLVLKHLPPAALARRVQIVTGYLKTRPAMPFLAALAQLHPGPLADAERAYAALVNLDALSPAASAIAPWRAEGQPDALIAALREVAAQHADIALLQRVALEQGDAAQRLLGAALSGVRQDRDELPAILQLVAEHHDDAPLVMLVAAELDPMATANVLALLLTEAKLQNPGDPEAAMTPARARMLCAARVLLPELGSPLSSVKAEDFTPIMRAGGFDTLGVLPRWLAAWRQALTVRP